MTQEELIALLDAYGVPPGDPDERLLMVLAFWRDEHAGEESEA